MHARSQSATHGSQTGKYRRFHTGVSMRILNIPLLGFYTTAPGSILGWLAEFPG